MILILTDQFDVHADKVVNDLEKHKVNYFRMNLNTNALKETKLVFARNLWTLYQNDQVVTSHEIDTVWVRRGFVELTLEELNDTSTGFQIWKNEWNKTLNGFYSALKNKQWLNKLDLAYQGENKYLQMQIAERVKFNIPPTIVSNDKKQLTSFASKYNKVVFKMMSQDFYKSDEGASYEGLYVNSLNDEYIENNFQENSENPIVLQKYIEKKYEVRYTVVGEKHFVCKIDSQKSEKSKEDWRRYDIPNTPHLALSPPEDIRQKVNQFMHELGLNYGALDFIVTPNNEWFFLEINCFGQWLWIEDLTGLPISQEISSWLINHSKEVKKI